MNDDLAAGRLAQRCGCGVSEAAGFYCTACLRATGEPCWFRQERGRPASAAKPRITGRKPGRPRTVTPEGEDPTTYLRDMRSDRKRTGNGIYLSRSLVWERDGGICHICGLPAPAKGWHMDHILPLSRGGKHTYENVAVSHPSCNLAKAASLAWSLSRNPENGQPVADA